MEVKDTAFWYFLNVVEYIPTGAQEPYEAARPLVNDLVLNRKQVEFLNKVKDDLYKQAIEDGRLNIVKIKILGMKKIMNVKFVVLLAFALLPLVSSWGQDNVIDEVVWVVGDEAILKSDVEEVRLDALYNGRRFDGDPYCVIPEEIAVQKLFLHQAALDSIEVSESEVVSQVDFAVIANISQSHRLYGRWKNIGTRVLRKFVKPYVRMPVKD